MIYFISNSFHEIGVFDLPAMINYILNYTKEESLTYIGHSMATTAMFITLSEHEEFNKKISLVIGYTPIAAWFIKNPLRTFSFNVIHLLGVRCLLFYFFTLYKFLYQSLKNFSPYINQQLIKFLINPFIFFVFIIYFCF